MSLELTSTADYYPTTAEAWNQGNNLQACLKADPVNTKGVICALILEVVRFVDAKKTLQSSADIAFTADSIIEKFPTLKLEELKLCAVKMKRGDYGNYYERLKTTEFIEAIKHQEGERADYLEDRHKRKAQIARLEELEAMDQAETAAINTASFSFRAIADNLQLPKKGARTMRDFMRAGPVLTQQEMKELDDAKKEKSKDSTTAKS